MGLDKNGRAELFRASKGMELSKIECVLKRSEIENYSRPQGGFLGEAMSHFGDPEETPAGWTDEEVQRVMESHAYSCYIQEC